MHDGQLAFSSFFFVGLRALIIIKVNVCSRLFYFIIIANQYKGLSVLIMDNEVCQLPQIWSSLVAKYEQ